MNKQSKKLDLSQLAKHIVDVATGDDEPEEVIDEKKKDATKLRRLKEKKLRIKDTEE